MTSEKQQNGGRNCAEIGEDELVVVIPQTGSLYYGLTDLGLVKPLESILDQACMSKFMLSQQSYLRLPGVPINVI